ncbi:EAL domain-containing protein [Orrella marina]|uniref:EAL domain-containing protein n=1 Tax=Orrella marina TaxID=2163011 RepID=UPI00131EEC23|nr:EAL domain-containing protein [Orrella marina]
MKIFNGFIKTFCAIMLGWATVGDSHADRVISVGVHHNPPKIFIDEDGTPSGILGELLTEIARERDWDISAVSCHWQECLDALESGRIDLMPDVALTPQRAQRYDFHTVPSHHSWSQLFARPGIDVDSILDLDGLRVAVLDGSVQQEYLASALDGFGIKAELIPFRNFESALAALEQSKADLIATNHHFGAMATQRSDIEPTNILFDPARLYYATPKGQNADLLTAIDEHLSDWRADTDSFYYDNLKRWAGGTVIEEVPDNVWWGLGGATLLLLITLAMALFQRKTLRERTAQIRTTEAKFETILNSIDAGVFIKDKSLVYQYVNDNLCKLLGMPAQRIIGHTDKELFDEPTAKLLSESDIDLLAEKERFFSKEESLQQANGTRLAVFTVKMPLLDEHGKPYSIYGVATDLTREHEVARRMDELSRFDSLTSLPNRSSFLNALESEMAIMRQESGALGLILVDLDNFKSLNDTRGHAYGDLLLIQVAKRLRTFCGRHGSTSQAARLSGDTFAILMRLNAPGATHGNTQLRGLAQQILGALTENYLLDDVNYRASASIGAAMVRSGGVSSQRVLRHAELALYEAKSSGTGEIRLFEIWMEQAATLRSQLEHELHQAIENKEFRVFYQIQVDSNLAPTGVEALVRWQHPTRGLLAPSEFIGFAESSGMIVEIGLQVLETACRQITQWQDAPQTRELVVAVNVSAKQLYAPSFVDQLKQVLRTTRANPACLEIEITESQLIVDMQVAIQTMQAIRAMGVRISLDDFGTGFSSLSHLRQLPLDQLKIDQAFVRDLSLNPNDDAIVRTIIELGNTLKLDVIAEGVETWAQHERLAQMGCERYQGYLFGRPCSVEDLNLAPGTVRHERAGLHYQTAYSLCETLYQSRLMSILA